MNCDVQYLNSCIYSYSFGSLEYDENTSIIFRPNSKVIVEVSFQLVTSVCFHFHSKFRSIETSGAEWQLFWFYFYRISSFLARLLLYPEAILKWNKDIVMSFSTCKACSSNFILESGRGQHLCF